ncbi:response regulator [Sphingomonas sp. S2-65]|uniref:response regulator n=1 Tax=Sphingomonas sp. S2-65 TaxID=2903960 RepID=UPI001F2CC0D6|nr:response regulator [Sphingomonas sp. S2-65]UYY57518.1 response regulator [Sphingomonas sp. S2-65]
MAEPALEGMRILVVEDEYLLADDLRDALTEAGAVVLGPVPSVGEAQALIAGEALIDAAVLDINLRGEMVFPVADTLRARGVPFAFATGYDQWALPERFTGAPRVEKPLKGAKVMSLLGPLLEPSAVG